MTSLNYVFRETISYENSNDILMWLVTLLRRTVTAPTVSWPSSQAVTPVTDPHLPADVGKYTELLGKIHDMYTTAIDSTKKVLKESAGKQLPVARKADMEGVRRRKYDMPPPAPWVLHVWVAWAAHCRQSLKTKSCHPLLHCFFLFVAIRFVDIIASTAP